MSKELLSTLGLCKRAGMLEAGEEPVESAARARDVRLLLLAQDAAENTARRAEHFAQMGQCILVSVPFTKEELGRAVGRESCAAPPGESPRSGSPTPENPMMSGSLTESPRSGRTGSPGPESLTAQSPPASGSLMVGNPMASASRFPMRKRAVNGSPTAALRSGSLMARSLTASPRAGFPTAAR